MSNILSQQIVGTPGPSREARCRSPSKCVITSVAIVVVPAPRASASLCLKDILCTSCAAHTTQTFPGTHKLYPDKMDDQYNRIDQEDEISPVRNTVIPKGHHSDRGGRRYLSGFDNGIRRFFETGSTAGIQAQHAARLKVQLAALNRAIKPSDMNAPGWKLHLLKGKNPKNQEMSGHWSISVNGNWRLTFKFDAQDVILVDYQDYH